MQVAFSELDAIDAHRERVTWWRFGLRFAGREFEQLCQVQAAILGEQQFSPRLDQLDTGQVQGAGPQAVQLQVGVEAFEANLLLARFANLQAPQGELKAERVELDALQLGRHRGVIGQLLVGDA
ncbi:hypothetical protein D3C77_616190 [compost metagenome]